MIAELLSCGHRGRIINAVSVRLKRDAAYRAVHEELARRFSNYRYFLLTTREAENLDPLCQGFTGKRYLQDLVRSGLLERETGVALDPTTAHVFLCGSPAMIGVSNAKQHGKFTAEPGSILDLLHGRGFYPAELKRPGNVHFERYW
jgi:ferredoxin--NADP+ reductase